MIDIKTTTQKLALKITIVSFTFLFVSFLILIWIHHYKFLNSEKSRLMWFTNMINQDKDSMANILESRCNRWKWWKECEILRSVTRDFLVLKWNIIVMTKWIYDFMNLDEFLVNDIKFWEIYHFDSNNKEFYVIKIKYNEYDLFFTRDISYNFDYEKWLILIFLLLSSFLSILIYFLSYKLAKISIEPLKVYNESLKSYNHHIAHELKTPLSVLKSDLELLKMWYDKEILNSSLEEVENMKVVIESMLFLSENGTIQEMESINLIELLENLIENYDWKDWKKIKFHNHSKKKEISIMWDKNLVKTMFRNLIENSIKYSSSDKIIVDFHKNYLEISNDFSYTIKEEEKNKLFEAFYKLNYDSFSYWLWLSIVKKISDLHNFKIEIFTKEKIFKIKIEFS